LVLGYEQRKRGSVSGEQLNKQVGCQSSDETRRQFLSDSEFTGKLRMARKLRRSAVALFLCLMLRGGFFFFDELVNQTWHGPAAETAGWFELGFSLGVAHETFVEWFLGADIVIVVESQLPALAAL
jgi:hypothetical protein